MRQYDGAAGVARLGGPARASSAVARRQGWAACLRVGANVHVRRGGRTQWLHRPDEVQYRHELRTTHFGADDQATNTD